MEKYKEYKRHPRLLELKLAITHTMFVYEFGTEGTASLWRSFCDVGRMNWTIISSIIGRKDMITELNIKNKVRYRQEIVFLGVTEGLTRAKVAYRYLKMSKRLLYEADGNLFDPEVFINEEWLDQLDYNVKIAGSEAYALEAERFLTFLKSIKSTVV